MAQPHTYTLGLVFTDRVDDRALPAHMQWQHAAFARDIYQQMQDLLLGLERFRTLRLQVASERDPDAYLGAQSVDFIVHTALNKAYKTYTNQVLYHYGANFPGAPRSGEDGGAPYEVVSLPTISGQLEIQLLDPHRDEIFWSVLRDSSAVVPYDQQVFIYNSWKYPGLTHPDLVRAFLADILRLQQVNSSADRSLSVADRWFVSKPGHDVQTARDLFKGLVASLGADLDANLPLEGRIQAMLPGKEGKVHVLLNIGEQHGIEGGLRLDVWRPRPSRQKVGQLEVVRVDSTSAVARLRKLDRTLKNRGEGPQVLDRVVSPKRPSRRRSL